ncbi:MAG: PRC-barrel domain-containing protein [Acidimicrobiia bacterium]
MAERAQMDAKEMVGQSLLDDDGETIGTVEGLILDHITRDPEWLAVRLGSEGRIVPVPLGALVDPRVGNSLLRQGRSAGPTTN